MKSPSKVAIGVVLAGAICLAAVIAWFSYNKLMACETHQKPILRWLDNQTLEVEIGTVAYVNSAIDYTGNVTIRYKIGKIMFKS